jgi:hypothetical protein
MREKPNWKVIFGISLVALSALVYYIHYLIFRDPHHIFLYLIGDIAFVFIEVFLVTLIIHHVLNEWEKRSHLKKLNMVIEVFFSDFGKHLLVYLSNFDKNLHSIHDEIIDTSKCCDLNFDSAFRALKEYKADIEISKVDLMKLERFLTEKRSFLINMLQNPNLLEHQTFTETVMSIFHITEELAARDLGKMPREDIEHTKEDIERAYNKLMYEWLSYMKYTKESYPYFFLYAMQTNPFDQQASWLERCYQCVNA